MDSPITNRIGGVFIPVQDMERSVAWYSRLLGLPVHATSHEGRIYELPMVGGVALLLDSHKPVRNSSQPLCFFWTEDMAQTYEFLITLQIKVLSPVEDIGSVSTLLFRDLDHNLLMVCQRNPEP